MGKIGKISTSLTQLPQTFISRNAGQAGAISNSHKLRKMLGEPLPRTLDPNALPPEIKKYFEPNGLLERIAKKLKNITKKGIKKIIPAKNTVGSVDEEGNLYVGVDFLESHGENEDLVAGILAHEWGHLISTLPKRMNLDHLTWDDVFAIRRDEEANADGFAGRALFLLGCDPKQLINFFEASDDKKKMPSHKYHDTITRMEIVKQSYKAMEKALDSGQKIFEDTDVKFGVIIGEGK